MKTPDEKITEIRKEIYLKNKENFDDICFTIFRCTLCGNEISDITLLPLVDKEQYSDIEVLSTQELVLENIFDGNYDFLYEKGNCDCSLKANLELRRVIYCYKHGLIDYHNYIDYPFEKIKKFQFKLAQEFSTMKILFFDTETTGLPINWNASYKDINNWPRLVQIAWINADTNASITDKKNYLVKPTGFKIPEAATKVHKITTQRALQYGHNLQFVLNQFNESIKDADLLVAHNVHFDIHVVAAEMYRFNIDSEIFAKGKICTMESTLNFCKIPGIYGYKYPKLSELHKKLFYTSFDETHDAAVDITATFNCFYELLNNKTIKL